MLANLVDKTGVNSSVADAAKIVSAALASVFGLGK
jgi:hypothetical protein